MQPTRRELLRMAAILAAGGFIASCGDDDGGGNGGGNGNGAGAGLQTDFDALLEAAREEAAAGTFDIWAFRPGEEATHQALFEAFASAYDLSDFQGEWLPLLPQEGVTRVLIASDAGQRVANNGYGGASQMLELDEAGLLEPFDWVATFGDELPAIGDAAEERLDFAALRGKCVVHADEIDTICYNTDLLDAGDLPESFEELTNSRWSGQMVLSAGGTPWHLLYLPWGLDKMLQVAEGIVANRPIFKDEGGLVPQAVAAGEGSIGVGSIATIEQLKDRGAPIDWAVMSEGLPTTVGYYSVLNNSTQPNLAHLFVAWLVTDGNRITEEHEFASRVTDSRSRIGQLMEDRGPDAEILAPTTAEQLDEMFGDGGSYSALLEVLSATG